MHVSYSMLHEHLHSYTCMWVLFTNLDRGYKGKGGLIIENLMKGGLVEKGGTLQTLDETIEAC